MPSLLCRSCVCQAMLAALVLGCGRPAFGQTRPTGFTSLVYRVAIDPKAEPDPLDLVLAAVKRRVDPQAARNLQFETSPPDRIEVRVPALSVMITASRDALDQAKKELDANGLSSSALMANLDAAQMAIESAQLRGKPDQARAAAAERDRALAAERERAKDFPARLVALDHFVAAYDAFLPFRDAVDVERVKRLLAGAGVLEFHILVTDLKTPAAEAMLARLKPGGDGPEPKANDEMRWYPVARPESLGGPTFDWKGATYVLAWVTPQESMAHGKDAEPWGLTRAYIAADGSGRNAVGFDFDANGAKLFGALTGTHINRPLATVLDGKVLSAPNINSRIERSGIIEGGRNGYTRAEVSELVSALNAGSLPAQLELVAERALP